MKKEFKLVHIKTTDKSRDYNYFVRKFYKLGNLVFRITYENRNGSSNLDRRADILNDKWEMIASVYDLDLRIEDYVTKGEKIETNIKDFFELMEAQILEIYKIKLGKD